MHAIPNNCIETSFYRLSDPMFVEFCAVVLDISYELYWNEILFARRANLCEISCKRIGMHSYVFKAIFYND